MLMDHTLTVLESINRTSLPYINNRGARPLLFIHGHREIFREVNTAGRAQREDFSFYWAIGKGIELQ